MDATNEEDEYARNQIRHNIIPYVENNIQQAAVPHLAHTAAQLREITAYIDNMTDNVYKSCVIREGSEISVNIDDINSEDIVILRELLFRMIEAAAGKRKDITSQHVEALVRLIRGGTGRSLNLPYNITASKDYNRLRIKVNSTTYNKKEAVYTAKEININEINKYISTDGEEYKVMFEIKDRNKLPAAVVKNDCTKWFDYAKIKSTLMFRYPENGDYIWLTPLGSKKKLSRILIDSKISVQNRKNIMVLAEGSHIIWIPELGRCSAYYYVEEATTKVLCANILKNN